jgi:hypothetical protein
VTVTRSLFTRRSFSSAVTMAPVCPRPPAVARNSASPGVTRRLSPPGSIRVSAATCWQKEPALWWFLPCTSLPMAPPIVAKPVPGSTSGSQPRGASRRTISPSVSPASAVSVPVSPSSAHIRSSRVMSIARPPSFSAASP